MQKLVFTNGGGQTIDLTSGNFGITNWEGLSNTGLNIQTQQVPFQDGGVFLDALMEQREISVTVAIQDNNDLSARYERKRQLISALNPKLGEGVLVYTNDYLSRQIKAVPQLPIFENKNSNDAGTLKASVVFSCPSPFWEDLEDTVVTVQHSEQVINNGDIPCQIKLRINSKAINPALYNQNNQKKIALNGTYDNNININTNIGNKKVETEQIGFKWVSNGIFRGCCNGQGKTIFVGNVCVVKEDITGETYPLNIGVSKDINAIIYKNNLFIAVGESGTILTSEDGVNWTLRTSGTNRTLYSITYGNGTFIAVGSQRTIITSSDGITWTQQTSSVNGDYRDIYFSESLGLYIATITTNSETGIITSSDGITWASQNSVRNLYGIVVGNGLAIAVGESGTILTSEDGVNWTQITSGVTINLRSICYGNNMFIITGAEGTILTSYDGNNWLASTSGTQSSLQFVDFQESQNLFIITGDNGVILNSTDGLMWNKIQESYSNILRSVVYAKDSFVAVGQDGVVLKSKDGISWESQVISQYHLRSIIYADNKYIIVGASGKVFYSTDGIDWTTTTIPIDVQLQGIAYGNGIYVIISFNAGKIAYSTDLNNWTVVDDFVGNNYMFYNILFEKGKFVITTGNKNEVIFGEDGANWEISTLPSNCYGITYSEKYGFVTSGNYIIASADCREWTQITSEAFETVMDVIIYSNGMFLGLRSTSSLIYLSSDGIVWNPMNSGAGATLFSIAYSLELNIFVIVGEIIMKSYVTGMNNIISNLTSDSDMTFNLEVGKNEILFISASQTNCVISYRQKYIGV